MKISINYIRYLDYLFKKIFYIYIYIRFILVLKDIKPGSTTSAFLAHARKVQVYHRHTNPRIWQSTKSHFKHHDQQASSHVRQEAVLPSLLPD